MEPSFYKQFTCMIYPVVHTLFLTLFIYLSIIVSYLFFLSVAGLRRRKNKTAASPKQRRIAVLITSYKEDEIIVNTVQQAIANDYPKELFDVIVAADHLQASTIRKLEKTGAIIFDLNFENSSKAKSLNFLLNNVDENRYEIALVLDGDNIMMPGFLKKINATFEDFPVMQAHRVAKNTNTPVAMLDAISEEVNNHLFRNAPSNLSLSSSLIGSGMAFPFVVLKRIYNKPGIVDNPACDREVDFEMLVAHFKIRYIGDAYVLDEKVSSKRVYQNQRRRWLESQLMHLRLFFSDWKRVAPKDLDFWNKLFINLIPPRILLLGGFFVLALVYIMQTILKQNLTGIDSLFFAGLCLMYLLSILISIPARFYNRQTFKALLYLPGLFFSFFKAALTIRTNRKEFVHTPKSYTNDSASTKIDQ